MQRLLACPARWQGFKQPLPLALVICAPTVCKIAPPQQYARLVEPGLVPILTDTTRRAEARKRRVVGTQHCQRIAHIAQRRRVVRIGLERALEPRQRFLRHAALAEGKADRLANGRGRDGMTGKAPEACAGPRTGGACNET